MIALTLAGTAGASLWLAPGQQASSSRGAQDSAAGAATAPAGTTGRATPAELAIRAAEAALAEDAKSHEALNALAFAYSRRARETADPSWYDRSDEVLARSLELAPDEFHAMKLRVWNQLGRHEFAAALEGAQALHLRSKDDTTVYGLLVDANVELGNYAAAEEAAQWMLNLRAGAPAAMTRVSYLRELFGEIDGAIDAMTMALHATRASELEDRAWMLAHLAHLELERGKVDAGTAAARAALALFPDYHYALAELGRAQLLAGDAAAAVATFERRYEVAPHPENRFDVAVALEAAGELERAAELFAEFEAAALAESKNLDNANLQLIEYWLAHSKEAGDVERALALARARAEGRRDLGTLEALAFALHRSGDDAAAKAVIDEAVAVGSVNARLRHRAGLISAAAGDREAASVHMEVAYRQAPKSPAGAAARAWLLAAEPAR